jgi:hypothetical protein
VAVVVENLLALEAAPVLVVLVAVVVEVKAQMEPLEQ